ncbi:MAG: DUF6804 family protein [Patescibacteria group bacterium]
MLFKHQYFILDDKSKKVFDENKKELRLTGNAFRMLIFLCERGNANLTEIGEYFDSAKDYSENHLRQSKYKINTVIGHDIIEYRNGVYSIIGNITRQEKIDESPRNTSFLPDNGLPLEENMNKENNVKLSFIPAIISILFLLLSFFQWPYGYYVILRIAVTCSAAYYAYYLYSVLKERCFWFWGLILMAIIFNPIVPIYLYNKTIWSYIDVLAAIIFSVLIFRYKKKR